MNIAAVITTEAIEIFVAAVRRSAVTKVEPSAAAAPV